jgi:hypothetical protein
MNERIRELKQQAEAYVDSVDDGLGIEHYRELVDLKFAELIVKECADIAMREDHDPAECIKKHFGVEE